MPFPNQVNYEPAKAVSGDFASTNPRYSPLGGPGQYVAGANGVVVGRFAWLSGNVVNNTGPGLPDAFVHREQGAAMIQVYLAEFSNLMPEGFACGNLFAAGDFWTTVAGGATAKQKVFVDVTTGAVSSQATGTTGATGATFTASIAATTMTVTAVASGTLAPNQPISGATSAAYIVSQLTGTPGGTGTYQVSVSQTFASGALTAIQTIETAWTHQLTCLAGELAKITRLP